MAFVSYKEEAQEMTASLRVERIGGYFTLNKAAMAQLSSKAKKSKYQFQFDPETNTVRFSPCTEGPFHILKQKDSIGRISCRKALRQFSIDNSLNGVPVAVHPDGIDLKISEGRPKGTRTAAPKPASGLIDDLAECDNLTAAIEAVLKDEGGPLQPIEIVEKLAEVDFTLPKGRINTGTVTQRLTGSPTFKKEMHGKACLGWNIV